MFIHLRKLICAEVSIPLLVHIDVAFASHVSDLAGLSRKILTDSQLIFTVGLHLPLLMLDDLLNVVKKSHLFCLELL